MVLEDELVPFSYESMAGENNEEEMPMNKIGLVRRVFSQFVDQTTFAAGKALNFFIKK